MAKPNEKKKPEEVTTKAEEAMPEKDQAEVPATETKPEKPEEKVAETKPEEEKAAETENKKEPAKAQAEPKSTEESKSEDVEAKETPDKPDGAESKIQAVAAEAGEKKEGVSEQSDEEAKGSGEEEKKVVEEKEEEKKPKRFQFPFINRMKKQEPEEKTTEEDKPISPKDAINALDEKFKVEGKVSLDEVAAEIDEAVEQMQDENKYWVIKINKKLLLLVLGVAVITMWLVPVAMKAGVWWNKARETWGQQETVEPTPEEAEVETSEEVGLKVRVRAGSQDLEAAEVVVEKLKAQEGVDYVELVDEGEVSYEQIEVITQEAGDETYQAIYELLAGDYEVASSGATLEESDIDVVVRFGE